jgi:hypothetical protein
MAGTPPSELSSRIDSWIGVGVYVYFDPPVQDVCKKYWKPRPK